jgi:hypothetical protein
MLVDYFDYLLRIEEYCEKFKSLITRVYFNAGKEQTCKTDNVCFTPYYQELFLPIKTSHKLLPIIGMTKYSYKTITETFINELENKDALKNLGVFQSTVEAIKSIFIGLQQEITVFVAMFSYEEKERINEAIHNYFEGCNYSCVAMSVSAVESRLLKLMCQGCPEAKSDLDKLTLGQLINEYVNHKEKYKKVVPKVHEPLLDICNTYRTFSVHPKEVKITNGMATSILNLSIHFLIGDETQPQKSKSVIA